LVDNGSKIFNKVDTKIEYIVGFFTQSLPATIPCGKVPKPVSIKLFHNEYNLLKPHSVIIQTVFRSPSL